VSAFITFGGEHGWSGRRGTIEFVARYLAGSPRRTPGIAAALTIEVIEDGRLCGAWCSMASLSVEDWEAARQILIDLQGEPPEGVQAMDAAARRLFLSEVQEMADSIGRRVEDLRAGATSGRAG
jgi:hypothetical protein